MQGKGDDTAEGIDATELLKDPATGERYDFSEQVGHLLRKAYQRHIAIYQELSPDRHVTSVQLAVLCALAESGPASPTTIGRLTAIDPATMRGIVHRLKERGLLAIQPDPSDGRKLILSLTAEGIAVLSAQLPSSFEITKRTLERLNPAEVAALIFLLKKISDTDGSPEK